MLLSTLAKKSLS